MKDFNIIKKLVGQNVKVDQLGLVDCYVQENLGLFIPSIGSCGYASMSKHTHPSYMIVIYFEDVKSNKTHYSAEIYSPETPHNDGENLHYYCVLIDKIFFEKQFKLYSNCIPHFDSLKFEMCSDILKTLNTFAFEYSKSMINMEITLGAQATVITHWIIRSILGETINMRAVSSDYSVARAQQHIEQHFCEKISISKLAELGYISISNFNRRFKKETGQTPAQYIINTRIDKSKNMLRRKNLMLTEIALKCGFNSSAHFSSCFLNNVGVTPSEYREKYIE